MYLISIPKRVGVFLNTFKKNLLIALGKIELQKIKNLIMGAIFLKAEPLAMTIFYLDTKCNRKVKSRAELLTGLKFYFHYF